MAALQMRSHTASSPKIVPGGMQKVPAAPVMTEPPDMLRCPRRTPHDLIMGVSAGQEARV